MIRAATRDEIATWPAGAPARTLERMQTITLRVVLQAVFGVADGAALARLTRSLRRLMSWTTDMRCALVFGYLGPDRRGALRGFQRRRADVGAAIGFPARPGHHCCALNASRSPARGL